MRLRSIGTIAAIWIGVVAANASQQASIIKEIVIQGNQRVSKEAIVANMHTKAGQPYLQENLDHDKQALEDLGFFQAVDITPTPLDKGNYRITVQVIEFPVIKEFRITGNTVVKTEDIVKVLTLKPGDVFNVREAAPSSKAIEALYDKRGVFARVLEFGPLRQSPNTVNVQIVEDHVGALTVEGNVRTKMRVMRRLIKTRPGDVLAVPKVQADLKRLLNTQWFESANPTDEEADIGVRNLNYSVKEAKTGTLSFGVQLDPSSSLAGIVKIADSNLQGTGQGLSLDLQQATQGGGPSVGLDYTDPFFDSKDTTLRASVYSRVIYRFSGIFGQTGPTSDVNQYYERRTGTSFGFTRPVNDALSLGTNIRYESVTTNIGNSVSDFIQQDGDVGVVTFGATLNHRDLDSDPSRGDFTKLTIEPGYSDITRIGGLVTNSSILGTNYFLRNTLEYRHYWTRDPRRTLKDYDASRHVLALRLRAGSILGNVPFFEQFFTGGVDTIRGYPEDRFWGRNEFIANLEYRYPLQKGFSLIPFVDFGDSWAGYTGVNDYSQSSGPDYHVGFGAGISFKIPNLGNIRLDLGFDNTLASRVHFQIGTPF